MCLYKNVVDEIKPSQLQNCLVLVDTDISRKVVGKKVHATTPEGNMGYDQYTVSDSVAVEPTIAASL